MTRRTKPPPLARAPIDQSVAGEEDPGAALDTGTTPASAPVVPCGRCGGTGKVGTAMCPTCGGTGKMMQPIGGG
jgi:RecJ-like exonuclease